MENLFITLVVILIVMVPALAFAVIFTILEKICSKSKKFEELAIRWF